LHSKFGDRIAMKMTLCDEKISLVPAEEEWDLKFENGGP
jgi:hypothetical protein